MQPLVIPISIAILIGLFLVQSRGTAKVGALFGPVILVYFAALAALGVTNIARASRDPAARSARTGRCDSSSYNPKLAFLALGSVFLAVTGAETLYADMGHFGRKAIGFSWLTLVYPCLMLNYMGQGALLLGNPAAVDNPFYLMAPEWARLPLVVHRHRGDDHRQPGGDLRRLLGHPPGGPARLPAAAQDRSTPARRRPGRSTSRRSTGACWRWSSCWSLGFREFGRLASAYGIAVTGTMLITTIMLGVLVFQVWRWNRVLAAATIGLFLIVDGTFFASNITKIPDGGWFPLLVAAVSFTVLTTWAKGRQLMRERLAGIRAAAAGVHQVGRGVGAPGARHVGVPVGLGRQRARRRCSTTSSTTRCCTSGC